MSSENMDCVSSLRGQSDSPYAVSPGSNRWPGRPACVMVVSACSKPSTTFFAALLAHLFEGELKLSCVKQKSKQELGVVLGVVEHLVFDLTQPLVVWVVNLVKKKSKNEGDRQTVFSHDMTPKAIVLMPSPSNLKYYTFTLWLHKAIDGRT